MIVQACRVCVTSTIKSNCKGGLYFRCTSCSQSNYVSSADSYICINAQFARQRAKH